jgi:predicted hotdog family 3-hydroxylacyl-ACP dehydratase
MTLMTARSALIQVESVPILQRKRDVVGVRKRSSRGKGLYSEDVHRHGRRNQVLSHARQAVRGQERGAKSKEQGARSKDDL